MQSLLPSLKVRAVRLGIMAAFVATFIGLPSFAYSYNITALQQADLFGIGENLLGYSPTPATETVELVEILKTIFTSVFSF